MAIIDVKKSNFEQEVLHSQQPVLIDFFSTWCLPCMLLSPIIQEISTENTNLKVCRINVEEELELVEKFKVMSIPTLVYMDDGTIKEQLVGFNGKDEILKMFKS